MNIRIDEAAKRVGGAGDKVVRTAVRGVRENPIPIVLIGIGVTWLVVEMITRRRSGETYDLAGPYAVYEGYDEDVGMKAQLMARMAVAKARLSAAFDKARTTATDGAGEARDKATDFAAIAQAKADAYGRAARAKIDEVVENEPLAIGALGLVLGAAIAVALSAVPSGKKSEA